MSELKVTAGEWRVHVPKGMRPLILAPHCVTEGAEMPIAQIFLGEEDIANAHLMAASKELDAALVKYQDAAERLLNWYGGDWPDDERFDMYRELSDAYEEALPALKKARGEA